MTKSLFAYHLTPVRVLTALLILTMAGCKQVNMRSWKLFSAPRVPADPFPSGTRPDDGYRIPDPTPPLSPVPPLPPPQHSIPLDPSPSPDPVPPSPDSSAALGRSTRIKATSVPTRNSRPYTAHPSVSQSRQSKSSLGRPTAFPQSNDESSIKATSRTTSAEPSEPIIAPGSQYDPPRELTLDQWKFAPNSNLSTNRVPLRKAPARPATETFDPTIRDQATSAPSSSTQSSAASVPVMLPPGG